MLDSIATCSLPVWQLVRASTAAPVYFPPETIELGGIRQVFVDGGITPYNNPALLLFSMATLPCYNLNWPTGVDNMLLVSVGTGRERTGAGSMRGSQMNLLFHARSIPLALMDSINLQQDVICRTIGHCKEGAPIDSEIGDLRSGSAEDVARKQFSYVRYDHLFTTDEMNLARQIDRSGITLDNLMLIPFLRELGARYAEGHVKAEHLQYQKCICWGFDDKENQSHRGRKKAASCYLGANWSLNCFRPPRDYMFFNG